MQLPRGNIHPGPSPKRLLLDLAMVQRSIVVRIGDGQGPLTDEMGRQAGVFVRGIVCITIYTL